MGIRALMTTVLLGAFAWALSGTAYAAEVRTLENPPPAWFTEDFREAVDASGQTGVPVDQHSILDVCPSVVYHEGGVGTGTCIVYPYGCTANFVYYNRRGSTAGTVSNGRNYFLGTAGHCLERGEPVYAAVSTPGVGPTIQRIGSVHKAVERYPDGGEVHDFGSIQIERGYRVYPDSPVGGPQGIYDGCDSGTPLKYWGHGYEVLVAQGKPEAGVGVHWLDDAFGWFGPAAGGDSGSGVLLASDPAAGDLTAIAIYYPPYLPGEVIGSRVTWILEFLGGNFHLVNQDYTLSRDTTSSCGSGPSGGEGNGRGNGPPPEGDRGRPDRNGGNGRGGGRGDGKAPKLDTL